MDPEHTFLRLHARFSAVVARVITPKLRIALEYFCFFTAIVLLALLVLMHVNFVAQPGCASQFFGDEQLTQITITSSAKRFDQSVRMFAQEWMERGLDLFAAILKGDGRAVAWSKLDSLTVDHERRDLMRNPLYLYSLEKGYLHLTEEAKLAHNIATANISIASHNSCFGNSWQRFLIDIFVGYDTILMNSLLAAKGRGYLYNFQTKELYNVNYRQDSSFPHTFSDYIVFKFGVFIMSLFVFFTTTMSVSFTLRETQSRMLKFTVQLQHHARHRLPTFHLIFFHVFESLVFVPIMIGILFFLFEFFDDQLLAFMVLTLVWLCELFTMISVRTRISIKYFPRFFFLYFMVFHIYFFSYRNGFSYIAFCAAAAFMQHLALFFWNRYEVPALEMYWRRPMLQQLTSSALLNQVARLEGGVVGTDQTILTGIGAPGAGAGSGNGDNAGDGSTGVALESGSRNTRRSTAAIVTPISLPGSSVFAWPSTAALVSFVPMLREQDPGASGALANPEALGSPEASGTPEPSGIPEASGTPEASVEAAEGEALSLETGLRRRSSAAAEREGDDGAE